MLYRWTFLQQLLQYLVFQLRSSRFFSLTTLRDVSHNKLCLQIVKYFKNPILRHQMFRCECYRS